VFTGAGTLTPHIVLGPAWVYEQSNRWWSKELGLRTSKAGSQTEWTADKFKLERAHLMHILAAHHGQIDWGSPVKPCSIEAILVHHLDNLDSKVLHAYDLLSVAGTIPGFTKQSHIERVPYLNYSL
jgi:hypothetical protein